MVPFGDQAPDAPDSSAVLDFYTHEGQAFWTLNVTGVEDMAGAKIVYGNPEVASEAGECVSRGLAHAHAAYGCVLCPGRQAGTASQPCEGA